MHLLVLLVKKHSKEETMMDVPGVQVYGGVGWEGLLNSWHEILPAALDRADLRGWQER